jgi:hypothetical protein
VQVQELRRALKVHRVEVIVVGELPRGDLLEAVTAGMEEADVFVVMGTVLIHTGRRSRA